MKTSFTLLNLVISLILFSTLSTPQNIKDKTKPGPLTPEQFLSLAHQSSEPPDLPVALKSKIIDYYSINEFNKELLNSHSYVTYEDSNVTKQCDVYFNKPWNNYYTTYQYDSQKRISKVIQFNSGYSLYTYNSNNKISSVVSYYFSGTPAIRYSYSYDSNNYLAGILEESWSGTVWQNSFKRTYTNDNTGNLLFRLYQAWDNINSLWVNNSYVSYQYDNNNLLVQRISQSWINSAWQNNMKYTYSYTGSLLTTMLSVFWSSNAWNPYGKDVYTYNPDNTISRHDFFIAIGSSWLKNYYENYSYPVGKFLHIVTYPTNFNYIPGSGVPVQWIASGISSVKVKYSTDNGSNWIVSASGVPDTGQFTSYITTPTVENYFCKIRIEDAADPNTYDQSIGNFTLLYAYDTLTHNTGKVKLTVFNDGTIGSDGQIGQGFSFMNYPNALYSGGLIFGTTASGAVGIIPSFGIKDLGMSSPMRNFTSNSHFNTISTAYYSDSVAGYPYNVSVKEQTFGKTGSPYIFYLYNLQNKSSNTLSAFYVGTFADWDIGSAYTDLGGYSVAKNMAYQFDNSVTDPNYYGIVALSGMSGANVTQYMASRFDFLQSITSVSSTPITAPGDYRMFIGSGPYNITPGSGVKVGFAFVAGTSLANLQSNADLAIAEWNSGVVGINDKKPNMPQKYSLEQNYPNPFNPSTVIEYVLPKETLFRIELYNSIGQKVKELFNGVRSAGTHKIYLDASSLAAGVYFYRFISQQYNETKKLILLK